MHSPILILQNYSIVDENLNAGHPIFLANIPSKVIHVSCPWHFVWKDLTRILVRTIPIYRVGLVKITEQKYSFFACFFLLAASSYGLPPPQLPEEDWLQGFFLLFYEFVSAPGPGCLHVHACPLPQAVQADWLEWQQHLKLGLFRSGFPVQERVQEKGTSAPCNCPSSGKGLRVKGNREKINEVRTSWREIHCYRCYIKHN